MSEQRGLCQHCGMWAYWDGTRWRHEMSRRAACPNGRTNVDVGGQPATDTGSYTAGELGAARERGAQRAAEFQQFIDPDHSPGAANVLPGITCTIPGHCNPDTAT